MKSTHTLTDRQTDRQTGHRNTNIELFRIISMLLIVAHHYVVNSGMMTEMAVSPFSQNSLFFYLFGAWGKIGINCFVMITGYFMCKSNITIRKFLKLLLEIEFYKIGIYLIFVLTGYQSFSLSAFVKAIIPVRVVGVEFTPAYIFFFLFIPFLNVLLRNLNEKMHLRLIFLCLFLYTFLETMPRFGVTMNYVSWFIVIYFIASYVRLYPRALFEKATVWAIASIISISVSVASIIVCLINGWWSYRFVSDSNSLLAVSTAFCAFMFFKNVRIPYIKAVNMMASASFGVLLIHANSHIMCQWLWKDTLQNAVVFNTSWCFMHFLCSVVGVYGICTAIDLVRFYLLEKPFFKFYDKHSQNLYSKLYSVENNLLERLHIH